MPYFVLVFNKVLHFESVCSSVALANVCRFRFTRITMTWFSDLKSATRSFAAGRTERNGSKKCFGNLLLTTLTAHIFRRLLDEPVYSDAVYQQCLTRRALSKSASPHRQVRRDSQTVSCRDMAVSRTPFAEHAVSLLCADSTLLQGAFLINADPAGTSTS